MKKIEIEGLNFLAEIDWRGTSENQTISEYIKINEITNKKGFIINPAVKNSDLYPMLGLFNSNEKVGRCPSLLGVMTAANRKFNKEQEEIGNLSTNWLVLLKIDGTSDSYWSCIIIDGMPYLTSITDKIVSFSDFIIGVENLIDIINPNSKDNLGSTFNLIVNESNPAIDNLQKELDININQIDLIELYKKNKSVAKIKTLKTNKVLIILAIIAIVGGYYYYNYQQNLAEEEEQARKILVRQQEEERKLSQIKKYIVEYEIAKKEAINNSIKNAEQNLNETLSNNQVGDILNAWLDIIHNVPLDHIGWKLVNINCSVIDMIKPYCDINLKRDTFGLNKLLLSKYGSLNLQINGDSANYTISSKNPIKQVNTNYKNLNDKQYFTKNVMTNFETVNIADIGYDVGEASEITYPIMLPSPPLGVDQNMEISPIETGISKGEYNMEGDDIWRLKGLIPYLKDNSLGINRLNIDFTEASHSAWKLNGDYYIKIRDNMIIPQIPEATIGLNTNEMGFNN